MDWRHISELLDVRRTVYAELKNLCVWVKDNGGMGSLYRSQHELVFVFKNGRDAHRNNVQLGKYSRNRSNVWHYGGANSFARAGSEGNQLALHPTAKPVALVADVASWSWRPAAIASARKERKIAALYVFLDSMPS